MKTVELNIPLLDAEIKAHRMKHGEFSELIGKSRSYLSYVKSTGSKIPKNVESLICKMLDKPDGYFIKSTEQPSGGHPEKRRFLRISFRSWIRFRVKAKRSKKHRTRTGAKYRRTRYNLKRLRSTRRNALRY